MKHIFFLLFSISIYAQNIISGNIVSEPGHLLQNVIVINLRTNDQIISDNQGFFQIKANINDELRFIKEEYSRTSKIITNQNFSKLMTVVLLQLPTEIEEINLSLNITGDLKKDVNLRNSDKKKLLNETIRDYIKTHPEEKKNTKTNTSIFDPPDINQGQINILSVGNGSSGGVLGLVAKHLLKKDKYKPNYSEIQNFHKKIKETFYGNYFKQNGLDEFEFDLFLVYLDNNYKFSEKYFNNFNTSEIERKLKNLLREYINKNNLAN